MLRLTIGLIITLALAVDAQALCSCQCLEGRARTVCTTLDEAVAGGDACRHGLQRVTCPDAAPPAPAQPLESPAAGAYECRTTHLLDPAANTYSIPARVCETTPAVQTDDVK